MTEVKSLKLDQDVAELQNRQIDNNVKKLHLNIIKQAGVKDLLMDQKFERETRYLKKWGQSESVNNQNKERAKRAKMKDENE